MRSFKRFLVDSLAIVDSVRHAHPAGDRCVISVCVYNPVPCTTHQLAHQHTSTIQQNAHNTHTVNICHSAHAKRIRGAPPRPRGARDHSPLRCRTAQRCGCSGEAGPTPCARTRRPLPRVLGERLPDALLPDEGRLLDPWLLRPPLGEIPRREAPSIRDWSKWAARPLSVWAAAGCAGSGCKGRGERKRACDALVLSRSVSFSLIVDESTAALALSAAGNNPW